MASELGPIIGVVGKEMEGVGTVVHGVGQLAAPVPVVGPIVADAGKTVAVVASGTGGALQAVTAPVPDVEDGHTTSEFKLAIGAAVGILGLFGVSVSQHTEALVTSFAIGGFVVISSVYAFVRTWRKNPPH